MNLRSEPRRCVIFGSGESRGAAYSPRIGDILIAADGGYNALRRRKLRPDWVIGDFDSLGFVPKGKNVRVVPREKDDPDLILAIRCGLEAGCREFALYGATGTRFDHSYANVLALRYLREQGALGRIVTPDAELFVMISERVDFPAEERGKLSIFSLSERSLGVTLNGLKYPLADRTLTAREWLGLSNEFTGVAASISVRDGTLLVVKHADWLE